MKFKSGDMVIVVSGVQGYEHLIGRIVTLTQPCNIYANAWNSNPTLHVQWSPHSVSLDESTLRLIKGGDLPPDKTTFPREAETYFHGG